jgi:transposase, IS30 family
MMAISDRFSQRMLPDQVQQIWDLRASGSPASRIGARVGWGKSTVEFHVREHGGVRPRWGRQLTGRTLSFAEREQIALLRAQGVGVREIGRRLSRSASTISRELTRNSAGTRGYVPSRAEALAFRRRRRPKPSKLAVEGRLRERVQADLRLKHSPEQIAKRLRVEFPNQPEMRVSAETIYQAVYLQARGGLKRELAACLRSGRTMRYSARRPDMRQNRIKNMIMIADRPEEVTERLIPGHWEGDLIIGKDAKSAIGTVVERVTNYLILIHLPKGMSRVEALTENLTPILAGLPDRLRKSLTWDQGIEMVRHEQISADADIDIYFADPHSPWQRASNENTNGLLRQYFPHGTDLSKFSQADLDYVAWEMNDRPRKRLDWMKPSEKIEELLLH